MGKLAVAEAYRGKGLGGVLLTNALLRIARVEMGVFAMLVDAKDEAAQRFYEHYGFTLLPGADRRLCLPIAQGCGKSVRDDCGASGSPRDIRMEE